jgi:hypothetical protein
LCCTQFTVPTATFRVLFVFVVLSDERRRVVHFGVTEHSTKVIHCLVVDSFRLTCVVEETRTAVHNEGTNLVPLEHAIQITRVPLKIER